MATVGSVTIGLGLNSARFNDGLKDAQRSMDRFKAKTSKAFDSARKSVNRLSGSLVAVAGPAALGAATTAAIGFADSIGKLSAATGVSTDALQSWQLAAQLSGVELSTFNTSLEKAAKRIGEAAQGTGAAAKVLEQMGVSVRKAGGEVRSTDAVILDFADRLAQMETPAERAAAAAALFGVRAGPRMALLLDEGSAGLRRSMDQAREWGAIVGKDVIGNAETAQDKLTILSTVLKVQLTEGLSKALPAIIQMGKAFAAAIPKVAEWFALISGTSVLALKDEALQVSKNINRLKARLASENGPLNAERLNLEQQLAALEARKTELGKQIQDLLRPQKPVKGPDLINQDGLSAGGSSAGLPADKLEAQIEALRKSQRTEIQVIRETFAERQKLLEQGIERGILTEEEGTERLLQIARDRDEKLAELSKSSLDSLTNIGEASAERIGDAFTSSFVRIEDGIGGMVSSFSRGLAQMAADLAKSQLTSLLGGLLSAGLNSFAKANGQAILAGRPLGKFAHGGSFTVPSGGSTDSKIPLFRADGGETVTITPKGKGGGQLVVNTGDVIINNSGGAVDQSVVKSALDQRDAALIAKIRDLKARGQL